MAATAAYDERSGQVGTGLEGGEDGFCAMQDCGATKDEAVGWGGFSEVWNLVVREEAGDKVDVCDGLWAGHFADWS